MKMNKKLMIPLFATVVGLSVVGGISGAVAWYQFNSRVSASFVGVSSADSGVLQISNFKDKDYGRDVYGTNSERNNRLTPVTFGFGDEEAGKSAELPNDAYCYPEAGKKLMSDWTKARKNYEYLQFDLYLKAQGTNAAGTDVEGLAKEVYLSEMFLDSQVSGKPEIAKALRVHLAVYDDPTDATKLTRKFLISREGTKIDMHGYLDLDGNGKLDRDHGYAWAANTNKLIDYGEGMKTQSSWAIQTAKQQKDLAEKTASDANYILAPRYDSSKFVVDPEKANLRDGDLYNKSASNMICKTVANRPVQIKVTVWLEGWALLADNQSYQVAKNIVEADYNANLTSDKYLVEEAGVYSFATSFDDTADYFVERAVPYVAVDNTDQDVIDHPENYFVLEGEDYVQATSYDVSVTYYKYEQYEQATPTEDEFNATLVSPEYYVINSAGSAYEPAKGLYDAQKTYSELVNKSAIWKVSETGEVGVQVGMQFDVGKNAFRPAN